MVRNKKPNTLGGSPHRQTGTLDDYMSTPGSRGGLWLTGNMAPDSPGKLTAISGQMLRKADTTSLLQHLRTAVREEIAALCTDLSAVEVRVEALETEAQASGTQHQAAELATTRQGNLLLSLRRQVEDLVNRLPCRKRSQLSFSSFWAKIQYDRIHRALGPPQPDGCPRDVLCCLHSYSLKEKIMAAARGSNSFQFGGTEVALYQDLSSLTLDARRALRPLTTEGSPTDGVSR
ncbi:Hypothetical predicted protein [Pelobates cultripes]|uniref:Uncharacterized protein n=1 Tax=Pelobates cultripes TaxID=61616 RepID=A0AAD1S9G2_PELCU|nr:Hypothetical predicted protein [Pelobates cultripes]